MDKLLYIILGGAATLLVLVLGSALVSRVFVSRYKRKLIKTISKESLPSFSREQITSLPAPVQRYLLHVISENHPAIRYAVLEQRATFRHGPERPWFRVKAREIISGMEPGWVWDAVLIHKGGIRRTAKLSYVQGEAHGHIKFLGAFTTQEFHGPETDTSMLFRLLSEVVWIPTAFLPTKALRWEPIDDATAKAVITDGPTRVSAMFHFNQDNEIERITTSDKYRDHKSGFEQASFTMVCSSYKEFDGVKIPTQVDFIWNLETGDYDYGHFTITSARYHYA